MSNASRIEQLHEQATQLTGLKDFGDEDEYLPGLNAFLEAVDAEVELTEFGAQLLGQMLLGGLVGRLAAYKGFADYPDFVAAPIRKPIIVTGFTRSGTTALHKLLASAPGTQGMEYWLTTFPMPRPPRDAWPEIPAYRQTVEGLNHLYELMPAMRAVHFMSADEPDECWRIIAHCFMTYSLLGFFWAPSYGDWLLNQDRGKAYEYYRKVLQLIGYRNNSTWVLKDPMHLPSIDLLLKQFPDACIVHTCREPVEVMPSSCSLMYTAAAPLQKNIDKIRFGRKTCEDYAAYMDQFMAHRAGLDPRHFLDVRYEDIVNDPVALARDIYRHFDIGIDEQGEQVLHQWRQGNQQHKYGRHEYRLEDYGLEKDRINTRLARYREAYLPGGKQR